MITFVFAFIALFLHYLHTEKPPIGKPTYDDCCEDLLCWENCFVNPLPELEDTYNQVYKVFFINNMIHNMLLEY